MDLIEVEIENQEADFVEKMDSLPVSTNKKKPTGFLIEIKKVNSAKSYASEYFNTKKESNKHISVSMTKVPKEKFGTHALVWRKK